MGRCQQWRSYKLNIPSTALLDLRLLENSPSAFHLVTRITEEVAVITSCRRWEEKLRNGAIAVGVPARRWNRLGDIIAAGYREQRSGGFQARQVSKFESVDAGVRTDLFDKKENLEVL
jgi:hypothetical protein